MSSLSTRAACTRSCGFRGPGPGTGHRRSERALPVRRYGAGGLVHDGNRARGGAMNRRTWITWGVSLGLLVGLWDGATPSSATAATGNPGWISSVSASHAQNHLATLTLPS